MLCKWINGSNCRGSRSLCILGPMYTLEKEHIAVDGNLGSDFSRAYLRVPEESNLQLYRCENLRIGDACLCVLNSLNLPLTLKG